LSAYAVQENQRNIQVDQDLGPIRLTLYSQKTVKATKNTRICLPHPIRPSTRVEMLPEAGQPFNETTTQSFNEFSDERPGGSELP
jgi:hypothetical protein